MRPSSQFAACPSPRRGNRPAVHPPPRSYAASSADRSDSSSSSTPGRDRDPLVAPSGLDCPRGREGRTGGSAPVVVQHLEPCRSLIAEMVMRHPEWPASRLQRLLAERGCCYSRTTIQRARRRLRQDGSEQGSPMQPLLRRGASRSPGEDNGPRRRP